MEIDYTDIAYALSQLALKTISGKKIEEKEYSVKISIPEELGIIFEKVSRETSIPIEELLGSFTKNSFMNAIQQKTTQSQVKKEKETSFPDIEKMIPGLSGGLMEGLNKIKDLASQLETMKDVLQNVPTNQENQQEPDVSTRSLSEQENKPTK